MTVAIPQIIQSTDSFGQWLTKTNYLLAIANNLAVTVNSNTAVGDAGITGFFTANNLLANSGSVFVGISAANSVVNATALTFQTSTTTNTIYSASGLVINGVTALSQYTLNMGNTLITSSNITTNSAYFTSNVAIGGNVTISNTSITTINSNTQYSWVSQIQNVGDVLANTFINRNGVAVYSNPTGSQVVNSYMTSTDLWISRVHCDQVLLSGLAGGTTSFPGNTHFLGANNYFDYGLNSNGDITIVNGGRLHIITSNPLGAEPINSNAAIIIDNNGQNLIQFRNSADTGQYSGLIFSDNSQGAYIVYQSPGGTAGANGDILNFGANTGFNFSIGPSDTNNGVAFEPNLFAQILASGTTINKYNGTPSSPTQSADWPYPVLSLRGYNDHYTTESMLSFGFSNDPIYKSDGSVWNFRLVQGDGSTAPRTSTSATNLQLGGPGELWFGVNNTFGNPVKIQSTGLQATSLGIGVAASGTGGEIRATNNITAYYASDKTLKTNVSNITDALDKVLQINGVEFDWTDQYIEQQGGEDGYFVRKHDVGVIAQEIEQVLPEVVATRENGTKAVKYDRIVALLIEAVKELKAEIETLKKQ